MKHQPNPMPTVEYDGNTYKLKSRKIEVPDFSNMDRLAALIWINKHTVKRGYSKPPNPLTGLGDVISIRAN